MRYRVVMLHLDEAGLRLASLLRLAGARLVFFTDLDGYKRLGWGAEQLGAELLVWDSIDALLSAEVQSMASRMQWLLIPSHRLVERLGERLGEYSAPMACRAGAMTGHGGRGYTLAFTWLGGSRPVLLGAARRAGDAWIEARAEPVAVPEAGWPLYVQLIGEDGEGGVCVEPCIGDGFSLNYVDVFFPSRVEAAKAVYRALTERG